MASDGHDLIYVNIDILDKDNRGVPDAAVELQAEVVGPAVLVGFGKGNSVTDEDYTDGKTTTYRGRATAILRAGYEAGEVILSIKADNMTVEQTVLSVR